MQGITENGRTRVRIKTTDFLNDLKADSSDEELIDKYRITWRQLSQIYSKLLHRGLISLDDLRRRLALRVGRSTSHIPIVEIKEEFPEYQCAFCGFASLFHFTACPECRSVNLRRLTKRSIVELRLRRMAAAAAAG